MTKKEFSQTLLNTEDLTLFAPENQDKPLLVCTCLWYAEMVSTLDMCPIMLEQAENLAAILARMKEIDTSKLHHYFIS
jgi:hypothetical protein